VSSRPAWLHDETLSQKKKKNDIETRGEEKDTFPLSRLSQSMGPVRTGEKLGAGGSRL
jgi:hypothetical protein